MKKIFFIADTHFSDERIIKYENRPFKCADEMNDVLIQNWNKVVNDSDDVYVLGDFGFIDRFPPIGSFLNGTIYLIKGNHDIHENEYYRKIGFCEVYDRPIIFEDFWLLSHKPLYMSKNIPYVNLFGHVHKNPIYCDFSSCHFCVSAERINYTPIQLTKIRELCLKDQN